MHKLHKTVATKCSIFTSSRAVTFLIACTRRQQRMVCFVCIVEHSSIKPTDCRDNLHSLHKALHTIDCTATPPAPKWMCAGQAACERAWHRASQDARAQRHPSFVRSGAGMERSQRLIGQKSGLPVAGEHGTAHHKVHHRDTADHCIE